LPGGKNAIAPMLRAGAPTFRTFVGRQREAAAAGSCCSKDHRANTGVAAIIDRAMVALRVVSLVIAFLHVSINIESAQILEGQLAQIRPVVDDAQTLRSSTLTKF
jgi:hypothetical protein